MKTTTAEEFAEKIDNEYHKKHFYYLSTTMPIELAKRTAIEFAKYHCKEQARVISENAQTECDEGGETGFVNKDSILNAYPLDLIK